jgi:hypothetical protein
MIIRLYITLNRTERKLHPAVHVYESSTLHIGFPRARYITRYLSPYHVYGARAAKVEAIFLHAGRHSASSTQTASRPKAARSLPSGPDAVELGACGRLERTRCEERAGRAPAPTLHPLRGHPHLQLQATWPAPEADNEAGLAERVICNPRLLASPHRSTMASYTSNDCVHTRETTSPRAQSEPGRCECILEALERQCVVKVELEARRRGFDRCRR